MPSLGILARRPKTIERPRDAEAAFGPVDYAGHIDSV